MPRDKSPLSPRLGIRQARRQGRRGIKRGPPESNWDDEAKMEQLQEKKRRREDREAYNIVGAMQVALEAASPRLPSPVSEPGQDNAIGAVTESAQAEEKGKQKKGTGNTRKRRKAQKAVQTLPSKPKKKKTNRKYKWHDYQNNLTHQATKTQDTDLAGDFHPRQIDSSDAKAA